MINFHWFRKRYTPVKVFVTVSCTICENKHFGYFLKQNIEFIKIKTCYSNPNSPRKRATLKTLWGSSSNQHPPPTNWFSATGASVENKKNGSRPI